MILRTELFFQQPEIFHRSEQESINDQMKRNSLKIMSKNP